MNAYDSIVDVMTNVSGHDRKDGRCTCGWPGYPGKWQHHMNAVRLDAALAYRDSAGRRLRWTQETTTNVVGAVFVACDIEEP